MELHDFSQYIDDKSVEHAELGEGMDLTHRTLEISPSNPALFFDKRGFCRFCNQQIPNVFHSQEGNGSYEARIILDAWACPTCGWWEIDKDRFVEFDSPHDYEHQSLLRHAILRRFDTGSSFAPISALSREIMKKPEVVHGVHHKKMEEIVGYVFSSYYDCDVIYCGGSCDGGIDLVLVMSDNPVLVQVKRRTAKHAVEPVASVREFLGAVMLAGEKNCIYVTTASRFSRESQKVAKLALERRLVNKFELVDMAALLEMLNLKSSALAEPWRRQVELLKDYF